jgi:uncharacterized protein YkwD
MKQLITITLAAISLILASPLAQGDSPADETRFTLRQEFLRLINNDRKQHGLRPVELDAFTSSLADNYCRAQIRNGTTGHFTTDGQAPYMRYSFAGGNDGVSENAAAWSATYKFGDRALYEMIRRSEEAMMGEAAPHDGHRRTILDPYATHVGIGLWWDGGEFRLTQEFLRHYVDWTRTLPRMAVLGERVSGAGRPARGYVVDAISVHYEPLPKSMPAALANMINSYSLPDRRRDYLPRLRSWFHRDSNGNVHETREEYADGRRGDFKVDSNGEFTFDVPFTEGAGVYTVVVWVRRPSARESIPASNVSIRVDRPVASDNTYAIGGGSR